MFPFNCFVFLFLFFLRIRRILAFLCLIFPSFSVFLNAKRFFFSFLMFVLNIVFVFPLFFHFFGFPNSKRRIFFPIFKKCLKFFFSFLMFVLNILFPLFSHFFWSLKFQKMNFFLSFFVSLNARRFIFINFLPKYPPSPPPPLPLFFHFFLSLKLQKMKFVFIFPLFPIFNFFFPIFLFFKI